MEWLGQNMGRDQAVADQKGLEAVMGVAENGGQAATAAGNGGWFQDDSCWEEVCSRNERGQNGNEWKFDVKPIRSLLW